MSNTFCKHCGAKIEEGSKFCSSCGKPVVADIKKLISCEDCGREFPVSNKVCPFCGCPVPSPTTATASQLKKQKPSVKGKNPDPGKAIVTIVLLTILTMLVIFGGYYGFTKWKEQQQINEHFAYAASLYNSGNYTEALHVYESFENNPEAENLANKCRYQIGMSAFNSQSWTTAKEAFLSIKDDNYGNINELVAQCDEGIQQQLEAEKRAQCADDKFLKDLEAVVKSMLQTNLLIPDETLAINNYVRLEKYKDSKFYDDELRQYAFYLVRYFDNQRKDMQSNSGLLEFPSEKQITWCRTNANIATTLQYLYDKYGFMKNNNDFKRVFLSNYQAFDITVDSLETISKNILDSLAENDAWQDSSDDSSYMLMHNNTDKTISVQFYYTDYVSGTKQYLGSSTYTASSIPPHSDYYIFKYPADYNYLYQTTVHTEWQVLSIK